jgi:antitoxin component YwqK of YwqJK toxin-antitoxin module
LTSSLRRGAVATYQPNGKELVKLNAYENGGIVAVYNKTGQLIAKMEADGYGNGLVGAYNRKGEGRTLQPGP